MCWRGQSSLGWCLDIDMVAIAMRGGGCDCGDDPRKVGDMMSRVKEWRSNGW